RVSGVVGVVVVGLEWIFSLDPPPDHLLQGLWTNVRAPCRALVIDLTSDISPGLRFLEESKVWLWPETRILLVGPKANKETVLLHHSLRNTLHGLYFSLDPLTKQRPLARPEKTDVSPSNRGGVSIGVYRRCVYCDEGEAGVQFLYSWTLHSNTLKNHLLF
ncbi:putative variant ionotropic glutamate receptor-like 13, partial [Homarus americanus]